MRTEFILPYTETKDGNYQVKKSDYEKFMEEEGITKEIQDKVFDANSKLDQEACGFLKDQVLESGETKKMSVANRKGVKTDYTMHLKVENRNPKTGEKITRFGDFRKKVTIDMKTADSKLLETARSASDDITAAYGEE